MNDKNIHNEKHTFEVDVSTDYGTIEELIKSKDNLRIVDQMKDEDRKRFFEAYSYCDKIEVVTHGSVGDRCFIEYEFYYSFESPNDDE